MYHGRKNPKANALVIVFGKEIFRNENRCLAKLRVTGTDSTAPRAGQTAPRGGNPTSATVSSKTIEDEVEDPNPLIKKLQDPKSISDRKVRR
jgi:hypothetical protein